MDFEITIYTFLIVCPLVFLGSFVDSIAGGGGLITLPAYMIAGLPPHYAIATNKLADSFGASVAVFRLWRNNYIDVVFLWPAVLAAVIGGVVGSRLLLLVDATYLQYLLLAILPITAVYVLRKKDYGEGKNINEMPRAKSRAITCLIGFVIAAYCGFYGPGTGSFLILALTSWAGMNIRMAAGSAKFINFTANASAIVVLLMSGKAVIVLGLVAAVFSMTANYIGSGMLIHKGTTIVRPIIIFVLLLFFVKVMYDMIA